MEALDDVVIEAEDITGRLELDLGENLEGFGLGGLMRHLAGLFALVIGIEHRNGAFDLRAQQIEAVVIDRLGRGADLKIGGNGEGRHEHTDKSEKLMGNLELFHNCLVKVVNSQKHRIG